MADGELRSVRRGLAAQALALLAISLLVNYVDRGNLSIAAPLLKSELHLSASQLGILLSGFFWTYTALQFVSGWLVDRFEVNLVIATGYLLWSLATAVTGFVQGFAMLLMMRLLLGIGESVAFPCCSKILALHLPEQYRGFANGLMIAGMKCGPAVGTFGAGMLMAKYGWRPVFIGIGLLSLIWLPAWLRWMPRGAGINACLRSNATRTFDIFRQRSFWGASAGHFSNNYVLYFMVTWLPYYLVRERQLSMATMSAIAGIYYLADASSALTAGWFSDWFIRRGYTPTVVRKSAMAIGHTTAAIGLTGCALAGAHSYLIFLMTIAVGSGTAGSGVFAFSQTLAGPQVAGRWTGMQNGMGNFAGVIGPALTGFAVDWTGNFVVALAITAVASLAGGFAWVFGVGPLEQINWEPETKSLLAVSEGA
jgi:MFS transporter, ACS family, D-galactonate transporter